jgi:guanylate kinase
MPNNGKLVLLMGPSGVGKSVILKELKARHPEFVFPRSATTRAKRIGEGADLYHFVSDAEFDGLITEGKLLEWAVVHGGARYGTLVQEILPHIEEGKTVVREVDVQGFDSIRTSKHFRGPEAEYRLQSIFILPENRSQLIARITHRAPITSEELERRIASMDRELSYAQVCDVQINHDGKIKDTIAEVEKVIAGDKQG